MAKKTVEEVRAEVLEHVRLMVKYWSELPGEMSVADRCDGVAFSILTMIDGSTPVPPLLLSVLAEDDDPEYTNGMMINPDCMLHELMHRD